ncbi:MAG: ABC transporter ATP-binding protein [Thermomicrobiales bacterium]|nr:ABC transporter ATP-binding protein [Thermomicrobiales bacterium]
MTAAIQTDNEIIRAEGLVKRYGGNLAVNGVDLTVYAGEIFGILGPNGAGKTTTLEMIEGLRQPDAGSIVVAGMDSASHSASIRSQIGVQLQTTALFDYLTAGELIQLFASLYETPDPAGRVERLLGRVGLLEKKNSRVDQMSGGQQQRLSIALGLVNDPKVAFLDEPTTGLDPAARRDLWETVREIRDAGTTVVLTTHYMEEAEYLCDRVAIMDGGRIIALDTPRALIRSLGASATISANMEGRVPDERVLASLQDVVTVRVRDNAIDLGTTNVQASLVALLDLASRESITLTDLRSSQPTLEDVFLALTGRSFEPDTGDNGEAADPAPGRSRRRRR